MLDLINPAPNEDLPAAVAELARRIAQINVRLDARGEAARLAQLPDYFPFPERAGLRLIVNPGTPRRSRRRAKLRVLEGGQRPYLSDGGAW